MAGLIFEDYYVEEASYKKNIIFETDNNINITTEFECVINMNNETEANVSLSAYIGDIKANSPFEVVVKIVGNFKYDDEDNNDISFETYLSENAIAILFPYLRSIISDMSAKSNEFPTLILPVINVVKLLEDNDSIIIKKNN